MVFDMRECAHQLFSFQNGAPAKPKIHMNMRWGWGEMGGWMWWGTWKI